MTESINGNLTVAAVVDTARMQWTASPTGTVWRKRVHLVGPAESGQVTTVVRFEAGAQFPEHGHPEGEEILVLDGVFSDHTGDYGAGAFLLNPEGFRHAPFSRPGCVLFVKLRQAPGLDRHKVALDTATLEWEPGETPGVAFKSLYAQDGYADVMRLERWAPQADLGPVDYPQGAELLVIDGQFADEHGSYSAGCWLRFPPGARHRPRSAGGCTLYAKRGGLVYLRSAA